jgi:pyruvate ferredoxin oxidoreductase gamma subunit
VLDDTLLGVVNITDGAQAGTSILINSRKTVAELSLPDYLEVITLDAMAIAKEIIGVAIVNTTMLGALAGATGIVSLDSLKHAIAEALPTKVAERNIVAAEIAYKRVRGK